MYYLFSPLMEDGKQVVRTPGISDFADVGIPVAHEDLVYKEYGFKLPILTMKRFEEDPFQPIRDIYEIMTQVGEPWETIREMKMFEAITDAMERLEGK